VKLPDVGMQSCRMQRQQQQQQRIFGIWERTASDKVAVFFKTKVVTVRDLGANSLADKNSVN